MIDVMTKQPLVVQDGGVRPFLDLPLSQVKDVEELLKRHDIYHWVSEFTVSDDDGPYVATIYFDFDADPSSIQAIFDKSN